jgi:hypothetical protein
MALPSLGDAEFSDESRKQTVVRDAGSPRTQLPSASPPVEHRSKQTATPLGDATRVHPPSQAAFARSHDPVGMMPNPLGGSPLSAASGYGATPGAATRRLPTSGIRPKPRGDAFNGTVYVRRPRRLIGIMIVLLLIGIGVALGVAFSGPELEVVDPNPAAPAAGAPSGSTPGTPSGSPSGGAAAPGAAVSGAAAAGAGAARQPQPPSELPGPPPATPGTP